MPDVFTVTAALRRLAGDHHDFAEFFRAPSGSLSLTIARWPAGSMAGVDHRFIEIDEDLEVLVFWSPARHTNG